MDRDYDLFELVDGTPIWRQHAQGLEDARIKLFELARRTPNECHAVHLPTHEVAARINVHSRDGRKPVVIQITYDQELATARSGVLRLHGYEVMSIFGNEAAKLLLSHRRRCDLFIIGYQTADAVRTNMLAWLRANYADAPIMVLSPANSPKLIGVDFTFSEDRPEVWLGVIDHAVKGHSAKSASVH